MARNYNRLIRFYDSWFDDLTDPDKGFTLEEVAIVLLTIRKCEHELTTDHLDTLPPAIRRGLQMNTLREQVERIIEKVERNQERAQLGAEVKAAKADGRDPQQAKIAYFREKWQQERADECGLDLATWRAEKLRDSKYLAWCWENRNTFKCASKAAFRERCLLVE